MVILACSLVHYYFGFVAAVVITVGEVIVDDKIVDKEVGYEETDFLDGSSSTQETRKFVDSVVVSKVTKN